MQRDAPLRVASCSIVSVGRSLYFSSLYTPTSLLAASSHINTSTKDTSTVLVVGLAETVDPHELAKDIPDRLRHCLIASSSPQLAVDTLYLS